MIKRNADRAATLTHRLLAFSRRQPLNPKPLDLNRLVRGMVDILHRSIGEAFVLDTVLAPGLWSMQADANELETAILNLVVNARDAIPIGGKLTIETSNVFLDDAYSRREGLTPGQYVMLAVSDGGVGMAKETIEQAFEPVFTTKKLGMGTGLGVSQVHGFIKQSGGHIKIYSEIGEGTTVKIYLPRFSHGEAVQTVEQGATETAVQGTETILVVEDEEDVRTFVTTILRERGFRVLTAAHADAALWQLRQDSSVALLLTDVGLPGGKNGRRLADEARELRRSMKVLFMTGYAKNAIIHHGRLARPWSPFAGKPFTEQDLNRKLEEVLRSPV
jgi:CheY-like chemotaxis protein